MEDVIRNQFTINRKINDIIDMLHELRVEQEQINANIEVIKNNNVIIVNELDKVKELNKRLEIEKLKEVIKDETE